MNRATRLDLAGLLRKVLRHAAIFSVVLSVRSAVGEDAREVAGDLVVFHAGSLSVPFKEIAEAFMKEYPRVRVLSEAAGSRACARKIADLGRACDVFGSADYTVIDTLLIPEHAEWCMKFVANEMAIAYTERSRRAEQIAADNWSEVLLAPDVAFGRSDPDADPCGYRTVLTARLAEKHYGVPGLADRILAKDNAFIRPKETDLLALLEVGAIDYIFIYRSVAQQHKLRCLLLPDEINLKDPDRAQWYGAVSVDVSGTEPGTVVRKRGAPMVYGVTIPKRAQNPVTARAFVAFLLDKQKGMAIMERNGQPPVPIGPSAASAVETIPHELKRFIVKPDAGKPAP